MRWHPLWIAFVASFMLLALPRVLRVSDLSGRHPSSSGAEEANQLREAEAYNYNIYLMVATPYCLLAVLGFFVYRGLRRKRLAEQAAARLWEGDPSTTQQRLAGEIELE